MRRHRINLALPLLLLIFSIMPALQAQDEITVSLAVPGFLKDLLADPIAQFEAENPGIQVHLTTPPDRTVFEVSDADSLNAYLDETAALVSSADVIAVDSGQLSLAATRSGYFLDLAPLVRSDIDLNAADFYPTVWQSFQWDNGMWGLPVGASLIGLIYDQAAFDTAGLAYPDEFWTLADLKNAIEVLNEYDAEGKVTSSSIMILADSGGAGLVISSLLTTPLFDVTQPDALPDFSSAELESLVTEWAELEKLTRVEGTSTVYLSTDTPLMMAPQALMNFGRGNTQTQLGFAPLPGGRYGLSVNGVAISAGTLYPEAAYKLAKFLTGNIQAVNSFFSTIPARRSLLGAEAPENETGPVLFGGQLTPEQLATIEDDMANAVPSSQQLFASILQQVSSQIIAEDIPARQALDESLLALADFQSVIEERRENVVIAVATPPVVADVAAGEVALKFGIQGFADPLPNQDLWDTFAADFAANDAQVGRVDYSVLTPFNSDSLETVTEEVDCFYQSSNIVPSADTRLLLPLDPLMSSDFTFNRDDVAGNTLAQMQRDGMTWGMPLHIQPQTMYYLPEAFQNAGAFEPFSGWTVADFENALRTLKTNPDDNEPFESRGFDGTYLLTLIAAYGGLPLDYRTTPATLNFADPATIEAIRQVLDLVKAGYIAYEKLAQTGGGFMFVIAEETGEPVPMYSELFLGGGFFVGGGADIEIVGDVPQYKRVTFPQGTDYTALAYTVGGAYISASSPHAEACYRFISALAQQTELLPGMPARRSVINSDAVRTTQGADAVAFYNELDAMMQRPNVIEFPIGIGGNVLNIGANLVDFWLYRVFDEYVEDETGSYDLGAKLAEAQSFADAYLACIADIPPFTGEQGRGIEQQEYIQQFFQCSVDVDPSTAGRFPNLDG
jgi:ABC-type glycerol-3-phosphate transport system substrate-binding protein